MKRILIVAPQFHPINGGYANAIRNMSMHLANTNRYKIHVLTRTQLGTSPELQVANLYTHRLPPYSRVKIIKGVNKLLGVIGMNVLYNRVRESLFLKQFFRDNYFDFIFFDTFEFAEHSLRVAKYSKLPPNKMGVRIQGCTETEIFANDPDFKEWFAAAKLLSREVLNIFSTTPFYIPYYKEHYCENNIYLSDKSFGILPNFPSPEEFKGLTIEEQSFVNELLQPQFFNFLTLGRMYYQGYQQKNFELIAQGIKLLKRNHPDLYKRVNVIVVGTGEMRPLFEDMLRKLEIHEAFTIIDSCSNSVIQELQRRVTATILVSKYEGHSMFATEAISNGSPVIFSKNTGISHLVEDGANGFLVDPDNPFEMAESIAKITHADIEAMRACSAEIYSTTYSAEVLVKRFDDLLSIFPYSNKRL